MQFDVCCYILASYGISCLEENTPGASPAVQQDGACTNGFSSKQIDLNFQRTCAVLDCGGNTVIFCSLNMLT